MPKDKLHAYYEELAPSAALQARLKALPETTPKRQKRPWLPAALGAAAVLALVAAGVSLHPKPTGAVLPDAPEKPPVVASAEPRKTEAEPVPVHGPETQETAPQTQPTPSAPEKQTHPSAPVTEPHSDNTLPPDRIGEVGTGSKVEPPLVSESCPVAGSYACVDGRDLVTLWSVDDPGDAVTLDVTEQMRGGAYYGTIEHGGVTVFVRLIRNGDGSCTLLVE